ncbi:division/cell wall cluster transcriptional repressor MraZ [Patescibacteria group bacterium]|nr:division/cell wall cluster transcriptional repressor MraZ [Patescibacteria group bacterium]
MLIGEYRHSIDEKKRLAIPSKFRKELGNGAVITKGLDNCLVIYPVKSWKEKSEKLAKLPEASKEARGYTRTILAGAAPAEFDRLGRIVIPEYLKEYAKIKKNVVITGLNNRLEVWSEKLWNIYRQKAEDNIEDFASKLSDFGV